MKTKLPDARKENRGYLTPNRRKVENSHPDHTGAINIEGTQYSLSGWRDQTEDGERRLNLSVKKK